jgi:cation diffusion facilitator family transporter
MIKLLAKLFIKNSENYSDVKVREQYGVLCGAVGIFLNFLLFFAKFLFGTISASVAMIADAFNNLSDAASSVIQILGFKLSSKKPDPEHPFGHGRIEYISGLIISFLILLMGFELLKSSVGAILHPQSLALNTFSVIAMIFAILVKLYMMIYNLSIAKKNQLSFNEGHCYR